MSKSECLKNSPRSNDEMMKSPYRWNSPKGKSFGLRAFVILSSFVKIPDQPNTVVLTVSAGRKIVKLYFLRGMLRIGCGMTRNSEHKPTEVVRFGGRGDRNQSVLPTLSALKTVRTPRELQATEAISPKTRIRRRYG